MFQLLVSDRNLRERVRGVQKYNNTKVDSSEDLMMIFDKEIDSDEREMEIENEVQLKFDQNTEENSSSSSFVKINSSSHFASSSTTFYTQSKNKLNFPTSKQQSASFSNQLIPSSSLSNSKSPKPSTSTYQHPSQSNSSFTTRTEREREREMNFAD
jgi:hypothetical protein